MTPTPSREAVEAALEEVAASALCHHHDEDPAVLLHALHVEIPAAIELIRRDLDTFSASARAAERERCCQAIRDACSMCKDGVFEVDARGDAVECEYCGRPMAAIRALVSPTPGAEGGQGG